jgi:polyvinyl alcohol dehydrogenase (cytochrome)
MKFLPIAARIVLGTALLSIAISAQSSDTPGETLYKSNCASCHDGGMDRAPARAALREFSADRVLQAMEIGPMVSMASNRSAAERRLIAEFITGKTVTGLVADVPSAAAMCKNAPAPDFTKVSWNGWGQNSSNTRFQDGANAGLSAADVPKLKVRWAFGFPGEQSVMAHSTIAGGRLFIGSPAGKVYSLDTATGCVHWWMQAGGAVRNAIRIERVNNVATAFFGDQRGNVYALDAGTGKQVWTVKVDESPVARVTGSIAFNNGKLYVPVASGEEVASTTPSYECCKFRGSITALDAATGKQLWKTYTIPDAPKPTKKNKAGTQLYGPSGAPIWSSPTIDTRRNAIYSTTGNNYSDPPTRMSNAFIAMDLDSGKVLWSRQMTEQDAYVSACRLPDKTNCPDSNGPDFDFSSGPMLVNLANGRRALVAGQKSGIVHAINPDQQGEVLWQTRVGKGGTMGGVQWGSATDGVNVYVANSDIKRVMLTYSTSTDADPLQGGGMFALRLSDGKQIWTTPPGVCGTRPRCSPAQSAAVTAIPGVAFSGSVDGHMRGYSTTDGKVIWDFDSQREYTTVNGVPGRGGSIDGPGPVISGGMLFMNSGYVGAGGAPGNVLLGLSVDGK